MTATTVRPNVDVRHAADRFAAKISRLDSKRSFSFGHHTTRGTPTTACRW